MWSNHLILRWSSQWVIGRNVTRRAALIRSKGSSVMIFFENKNVYKLTLDDNEDPSFMSSGRVLAPLSLQTESLAAFRYNFKPAKTDYSWKEKQKTVDTVHENMFEHSSDNDIRTLLPRGSTWYKSVRDYLLTIRKTYAHCMIAQAPGTSRLAFLQVLNSNF